MALVRVRTDRVVSATAPPPPPDPPPNTGDLAVYGEHVGYGSPGLFNPASIVVTSAADSGPGTLRAALTGNAHKHITFASNMTITVNSTIRPGANSFVDGRGRNISVRGTNTSGGFFFDNTWNVTMVNLTLTAFGNLAGTASNAPEDAILMYGSRDIWLHHLDLSAAADKAIGIQQGCGDVTVSWCHFHNQSQTFQIGSQSGGEVVDSGQRVTVHHCYFDGTGYRNPVISYGRAHVFNNYYRDWQNYGARAQRLGQLLFEHNAAYGIRDANVTEFTTPGNGCNDSGTNCDDRDGYVKLVNNVQLPGSIALNWKSNLPGNVSNAPYAYTLETASQTMANAIAAGAGATR